MKLITKDVDYAVKAISYIAKNKKNTVSITELTGNLKIPQPFLRKILQILNKNRILKSIKGRGGGFTLNARPEDIRLVHLIKIFRGDIKFMNCIFKKAVCSDIKNCPLRRKVKNIEQYVLSELKDVTIASLIK